MFNPIYMIVLETITKLSNLTIVFFNLSHFYFRWRRNGYSTHMCIKLFWAKTEVVEDNIEIEIKETQKHYEN